MSKFHNTVSAEKLALNWHGFGVAASLWWAMTALWACVAAEPFAHYPGLLGLAFWHEHLASGVNVFIALCGAAWHLWAAREHREHLREISAGQ